MEKIFLWAEEAPQAKGETLEDRPHIIPYIIESEEPAPVIIVCPGGGYTHRADHEGAPVAEWLNSIGISAFVLHYRVNPYRHPVPLNDAKRAIRLIRSRAAEFGIDSNRLGILGFSAGGHLASTAAIHFDEGDDGKSSDPIERECSRPNVQVLCYPVISFGGHGHEGSITNLLGTDAAEELKVLLSSEKQVKSNTPPAFIWHTSDDGAVKVANSILIFSALIQQNIPCEFHSFESGRHGIGLALDHPEAYTWTKLCENWLRKQGF